MVLLDHHAVAGAGGGVITAFLLQPLDVVKVRFQVCTANTILLLCPNRIASCRIRHAADTTKPISRHPQVQDGTVHAMRYSSVFGAVKDIWKTEGIRGFYRGMVASAWGSGMSWGLYFYFYEACKRRLLANDGGSGTSAGEAGGRASKLSPMQHMYAAWEGGSITCLFTNPLWLIKTRMQLQTNSPSRPEGGAYRGLTHALKTIIKEEGPLGLYRGLLPALILTSHGMVQFGVYEELKAVVAIPDRMQSAYYFAFGGISKAAAVTVTYPYQVVKARMQQRFEGGRAGAGAYAGFISSVQRIWQHEGMFGFYKGFAANLLRVAPQSAITLVAYEEIKRLLDALDKER